jgi:hypothetical protein
MSANQPRNPRSGSTAQPRKPAGTPVGGQYDNVTGGGAAASLGEEVVAPQGRAANLASAPAAPAAKWIETPDGRRFGPFDDTKAVEQFVVSNHIQLDLDEFDIVDSPVAPEPTPARATIYEATKIDKREARRRWERGLPVAMSDRRGAFDDAPWLNEREFATRHDVGDRSRGRRRVPPSSPSRPTTPVSTRSSVVRLRSRQTTSRRAWQQSARS